MQHTALSIVMFLCEYLLIAAGIKFLHCFYDAEFRWNKKKALLLLIPCIFYGGAYYFLHMNFWSTIATIFAYIVIFYDYKGKKLRGFLRFICFQYISIAIITTYSLVIYSCILQDRFVAYMMNTASSMDQLFVIFTSSTLDITAFKEVTEVFVASVYAVTEDVLLLTMSLGALFFAVVLPVLSRLYKRGVIMQCKIKEIILLLVPSILFSFFFPSVMMPVFGLDMYILLCTLAIMVLLFAVLFPIFIYASRLNEYYRNRTTLQDQHMQAELTHFQQYQQSQEETSRFRHDIRNNLICVTDLLQQGKTEDASAYLKDLLEVVDHISKKYVTGDLLLDSIVGVKAQIMEQNGITFELDGVLAGGLRWKPMDICNVFANILDNAIEACLKLPAENRRITMTIKATSQFWLISIENPVKEAVDISKLFQKNGGYSSKPDFEKHGIGTYTMKHTIESYGAMLRAECSSETFKLEIAVDKNK